ncbi:uncharacterized protein LOC130443382 [Diorhabda sublineata]|uniref:uncharacterized protein LOC130443382 n=1 Tax=Diorhabda sublineata TaxID=1163346 RepID=UPI0024E0C155|nr:uncharacterized protein LOC130443382 [Diorhabda sublineata]
MDGDTARRLCSLFVLVILANAVLPDYQFINPIRFPYSSTGNPYVGLFVAIALPINITGPADLFISANFESSYSLPENVSVLSYPPIVSSARLVLYELLESKIKRYGYSGKLCLQRAICETADYTTEHHGVLGDILHVLLTPSSSQKENGLEDYANAETYGRTKGHCEKYKKKCPFSILNAFSVVKDAIRLYDPEYLKKELSFMLKN